MEEEGNTSVLGQEGTHENITANTKRRAACLRTRTHGFTPGLVQRLLTACMLVKLSRLIPFPSRQNDGYGDERYACCAPHLPHCGYHVVPFPHTNRVSGIRPGNCGEMTGSDVSAGGEEKYFCTQVFPQGHLLEIELSSQLSTCKRINRKHQPSEC